MIQSSKEIETLTGFKLSSPLKNEVSVKKVMLALDYMKANNKTFEESLYNDL